ncbi:hypothetical protein HHI36_015166 [Cryptolaemus montrouzieri]|uniref:Uncharacterized protein n=1 Tax=Cryptolaemus montrouzieri TaxID=559131 RepID=A0ABD2N4V0_9CUCU
MSYFVEYKKLYKFAEEKIESSEITCLDDISNIIKQAKNLSTSTKQYTIKNNIQWMNNRICYNLKKRDKLQRMEKNSESRELENKFKKLKNAVTNLIRKSERGYI